MMFQFFRNWRHNRRLRKLAQVRAILPFWDGEQVRFGDPFAIFRAITQDKEIALDRVLSDVDKGLEPITTQVIELICRSFGVRRWNVATSRGLTDLEIIGLLTQILGWREDVKKNSNDGPTLPAATDLPSSTPPAAPAEATNVSADSTPT